MCVYFLSISCMCGGRGLSLLLLFCGVGAVLPLYPIASCDVDDDRCMGNGLMGFVIMRALICFAVTFASSLCTMYLSFYSHFLPCHASLFKTLTLHSFFVLIIIIITFCLDEPLKSNLKSGTFQRQQIFASVVLCKRCLLSIKYSKISDLISPCSVSPPLHLPITVTFSPPTPHLPRLQVRRRLHPARLLQRLLCRHLQPHEGDRHRAVPDQKPQDRTDRHCRQSGAQQGGLLWR